MARPPFWWKMAFTYNFTTAPLISYTRLLVADTDSVHPIFSDAEITAAHTINSATWSSGQFYSGQGGANLPSSPSNYLRAAALLLNCIAANKSKLAAVQGLLDVKLNAAAAADALRKQAAAYLEMDDNSGAIFISEQVQTCWAFKDRFWAGVQRQAGGTL